MVEVELEERQQMQWLIQNNFKGVRLLLYIVDTSNVWRYCRGQEIGRNSQNDRQCNHKKTKRQTIYMYYTCTIQRTKHWATQAALKTYKAISVNKVK